MISDELRKSLAAGNGIRSAFLEACRQKKQYGPDNVFDLSIGNPLAPAPEEVKSAMLETASDPDTEHLYMTQAGYEDVREAIAKSLNRRYGSDYSTTNIIMTTGAAGGLCITLKAFLDPGDEVVIIRPYYPAYIGFISNCGGIPVVAGSDPLTFQPDLDDISGKITESTKIVLINSPHNPSGAIYDGATAAELAELLRQKNEQFGTDICLLSDEPYRELVYDDTEIPWWPDYYENTIVAYSFSKSLSLAGERIGYLTVPGSFNEFDTVISALNMSMGRLGFVNAPAFFQRIAAKCADVSMDLSYYREARDLLYDTLTGCGFDCAKPQGAFYVFIKAPGGDEEGLLSKAAARHVLLVGGSSFGWPGWARASFCCGPEVMKRALPALRLIASDCGLTH